MAVFTGQCGMRRVTGPRLRPGLTIGRLRYCVGVAPPAGNGTPRKKRLHEEKS
jgi:hypothetical protein